MSNKPVRLLLIEDNPGDARLIREFVSEIIGSRYLVQCAEDLSKGLELLAAPDFDLVLLDLSLPDSQGFDTFAALQARAPDLPIVVVTGFNDELLAVQAVQAGAQDYLVKGEFGSALLSRAMRYAIERKKTEIALRREREDLEARVERRTADLAKANDELRNQIAERSRMEKALRAEHAFQDIINFLPDATFVIDQRKRVIAWNRAIEEMTGVKQEEIAGEDDYAYAVPFYGERRPILIDFLINSEHEAEKKYDFINRKDRIVCGETFVPGAYQGRGAYLWGMASPLFDQSGNIIGAIQSIRDVSERRRAEQELSRYRDHLEDLIKERTTDLARSNSELLREITERKHAEKALLDSERKFRELVDDLNEGVFIIDSDATTTFVNPQMASMLGYSVSEMIGKHICEFIGPEWVELYGKDLELLKRGLREEHDCEFLRRDGARIIVQISTTPITDKSGTYLGFIAGVMDITARKRMEVELCRARDELELVVQERTAELRKANEELRQIPSKLIAVQEEERKRLASELHDSIGQTLAAVKFWVEMILRLKDEGEEGAALNRLEQFVPILQRSIEETRSIYMGLRPSMLDSIGLLPTLEWLRMECMKLYPERHIELEAGVAEEEVSKDLKVNIFRIAQEALNNIAKHSKAEWVDISLRNDGGGIGLVVSDDGVGMDPDRVEQTGAPATLGLTSMRERAELTGGNFSIESASGEGTTIRAFWPVEAVGRLKKGGINP
jgi:PAS domain S-box-containing protein